MAYQMYTTEAIVCGSYDSYTSDKSYLLFTQEAGMLFANAKSVREEKSKQRYALQDFSIIRVSLVKGKSGWRIGSVDCLSNPFLRAQTRMQRGLVSYVVKQLRRYVQGESPLPNVYEDVRALLTQEIQPEDIPSVQMIFSLRLLATLGYIVTDAVATPLTQPKDINQALAQYTTQASAHVENAIAQAAQVSHL